MTRTLHLVAAAALCAALGATQARAGVVITQSVTAADEKGGSRTVTQTLLIEGNRSKSVMTGGATITDLDKKTMTILDTEAKTATEVPIDSYGPLMSAALSGEFKPTGTKKTVAGYDCEEYEHKLDVMKTKGLSRSCVSKAVPGAEEAASFQRRVIEAMIGKSVAAGIPEGVTLAEETEIEPITDVPAEGAKGVARTMAAVGAQKSKTEVTSIEARSVSADEFAIPAGYKHTKLTPR
jgi:hypothetical protein